MRRAARGSTGTPCPAHCRTPAAGFNSWILRGAGHTSPSRPGVLFTGRPMAVCTGPRSVFLNWADSKDHEAIRAVDLTGPGLARIRFMFLTWIAFAFLASSCGQTISSATQPTPPTVPNLTGAASRPPGGPVPAQLLGDWFLPPAIVTTVTGNGACRLLRLTLAATTYHLAHTDNPACGTSSSGDVVVNGTEIDFFSSDVCGLQLPDGVGRYMWTLASGVLHFAPLNEDRCPRGAAWLANRTYSRANGA
jgi:hypothetical protein